MKIILILLSVLLFFSSAIGANAHHLSDLNREKADAYVLAYPGMLPNSPFYFIKEIRDKVQLMLISDEVKKIDRAILLGDKYIASAKMLNKDKADEKSVISSVNNGVNYLKTAEEKLEKMQNSSDKKMLANKIHWASDKYFIVISDIQKTSNAKESYSEALSISRDISEKAERFTTD